MRPAAVADIPVSLVCRDRRQSERSRRLCSQTSPGRPAGIRVLPDLFRDLRDPKHLAALSRLTAGEERALWRSRR